MKQVLLAAALMLLGSAAIAEKAPTMEEMWRIIQAQQAEIERLKANQTTTEKKVEATEKKVAASDKKIEATADAVEQVASGPAGKIAQWAEKTSIGGYGEHHFNHFKDKDDQVDAHRFVVYVGHAFSDTVRFFSEVELEHSLSGDGKPGEVELEQAFIEWDYMQNHSVTFGQYLIPVGILNETHEPDTFYGVERNNVEKNIIPATWWETGVMATGSLAPGLSYNLAVHSGLETAIAGDSAFNIRSGRQKSAKANAEDLAFTARLKYTGIPGLEIAASAQHQQDIAQGGVSGEDISADLYEAHAIWNYGPLQIIAMKAWWELDGNASWLDSNSVARSFDADGHDEQEGWYLESSYKLTDKLGVFARKSVWDNRAGSSLTDSEITQHDVGLNFWLVPNVVLKADFTESDEDENSTTAGGDSMNLGVGWSF